MAKLWNQSLSVLLCENVKWPSKFNNSLDVIRNARIKKKIKKDIDRGVRIWFKINIDKGKYKVTYVIEEEDTCNPQSYTIWSELVLFSK